SAVCGEAGLRRATLTPMSASCAGEVSPDIEARRMAGFRAIDLVRRERDHDVAFVTLMWFDTLDSARSGFEVVFFRPRDSGCLIHACTTAIEDGAPAAHTALRARHNATVPGGSGRAAARNR